MPISIARYLLPAALLLCPLATPWAEENKVLINIDNEFAINLMSTNKAIDADTLNNHALFSRYRLYTAIASLEGRTWTRLRLGFFPTKQDAIDAHKLIINDYPHAWVTLASEEERINSGKTALLLNGPLKDETRNPDSPSPMVVVAIPDKAVKLPAARPSISPALSEPGIASSSLPSIIAGAANDNEETASVNKKERLLSYAQKAITAGNYDQAIQFTTALLDGPETPESREALELLGLARERKGQLAHARAEYEKYLILYPDGEDSIRVNQRLSGLITATSQPTSIAALPSKKIRRKGVRWKTFGSLSQFYYHDELSIDDVDNRVQLSQLVTTFDLSSRGRSARFDQRIQVTGDYANDFIDKENDGRFSRLYYELIDKVGNNKLKIGRQNYSKGGVLGRFDGALFGLGLTKRSSLNLTAGYLLDFDNFLNFDYEKNRRFVSLALDVGNQLKDWDISIYGIQQMVDEIVDRQAIGGEIRYFKSNYNIYSVIDYDTSYNELNIFLLNANWLKARSGSVYATIDIRKVPYLSSSNALQGQPFPTIKEMLSSFSEEQIRQLARDRTSTSNTFTLGGTKQLTGFLTGFGQYQVSADFTVNTITGMPESGGVPEIPASGKNYFLGGQFIGNSILKNGDTSILSLRYGSTQNARDIALSVDTRYPISSRYHVNPRLRYVVRKGRETDSSMNTLRLSLKADYQYKSVQFEGEIGFDSTTDTVDEITTRSRGFFSYIGYRWDF